MCIFCKYINKNEFILSNNKAIAIYDQFPVNKGHMLIIPKRHFSSFFESTKEETEAIYDILHQCKVLLDREYSPDGYNIGINIGEDAGQTIMHLHVHLIPRYNGDVEQPKGGIRNLKKPLIEY